MLSVTCTNLSELCEILKVTHGSIQITIKIPAAGELLASIAEQLQQSRCDSISLHFDIECALNKSQIKQLRYFLPPLHGLIKLPRLKHSIDAGEEFKMLCSELRDEKAYFPLYKIEKISFTMHTYSDFEAASLYEAVRTFAKDLKELEYTHSPTIHFQSVGAKIISRAWHTAAFTETYKIAHSSGEGSFETAMSSTPLLVIGAEVRYESKIISP